MKAGFELEFQILTWGDDLKNSKQVPMLRKLPVENTPYASADGLDDHAEDIMAITEALESAGIEVVLFHKEVAPGQIEIVTGYGPVIEIVDKHMMARHIISAVCKRRGKKACFIPNYDEHGVGSGCHVHLSLWKDGKNITASETKLPNYDTVDPVHPTTQQFIAGILQSYRALSIFLAPTSNSLSRIRPGYWAGAFTCWGFENRDAPVRVP